jgi:hypothetical protein
MGDGHGKKFKRYETETCADFGLKIKHGRAYVKEYTSLNGVKLCGRYGQTPEMENAKTNNKVFAELAKESASKLNEYRKRK